MKSKKQIEALLKGKLSKQQFRQLKAANKKVAAGAPAQSLVDLWKEVIDDDTPDSDKTSASSRIESEDMAKYAIDVAGKKTKKEMLIEIDKMAISTSAKENLIKSSERFLKALQQAEIEITTQTDDTQMNMLQLQKAMQMQNQMLNMSSNIMKSMNDARNAMIRNLK